MTRRYSLVIEGDETGYSAYVPELATVVVTGRSVDELTSRAREAIQVYWSAIREDWPPSGLVKEIEVELPA
jgi:predicted RNase H-like HicB family nuclease